jgi:hypothetical protein
VKAAALALAALAGLAPAARAQRPWALRPTPEARVDVVAGRDPGGLAGAGLFVDAGDYARVGVTAAGGVLWAGGAGGRRAGGAGEAALVGRFLLDPRRQAARGVYAAGGVGVRAARGTAARPFLLAAVGVEGARTRAGVAPALELGVGGGARLTVVVRRARPGRR